MAKITVHNSYFNTKPVAFHHHGRFQLAANNEYGGYDFKGEIFKLLSNDPGVSAPMFRGIKENRRYFQPPASKIRNPINEKLQVFTVCNRPQLGCAMYCMDYFGMDYCVLGADVVKYDHWVKIGLLLEYIPTITKPYTMFMDADDIFFSRDPTHLVETFESEMNCSMLLNGEGWFYPKGYPMELRAWEDEVACDKSPYKYLNSGLWIANTNFLQGPFYQTLKAGAEAFKNDAEDKPYSDNDQGMFHCAYNKLYPDMRVDHTCQYFQSGSWSSWLQANYPEANHVYIEGSTTTCKSGVAS